MIVALLHIIITMHSDEIIKIDKYVSELKATTKHNKPNLVKTKRNYIFYLPLN